MMFDEEKKLYGIVIPSWFSYNKPPSAPDVKIQRDVKSITFSDDETCSMQLSKILDFIGDHPISQVIIKGRGTGWEGSTGEIEVECFEVIDNPSYKDEFVVYERQLSEWHDLRTKILEAMQAGVPSGLPSYMEPKFWIRPMVDQNTVEEFIQLDNYRL